MRPLRVHRHSQIAQAHGDAMERERHRAKDFMKLQPVIGGFSSGQGRELVGRRPVKFAAVHDAAAGDGAIAGQVFGGRMHHQRRPMFNRAAQIGRGGCVIDDQRNASGIGHFRHRIQIGDVTARVGDGFAKHRAGVIVNGGGQRIQIVKIDEFGGPAEFTDRVGKLLDRAAIQPGGRDHIAPRGHQREQRHDLRRVPRRTADRTNATLKCGNPFLQHGDGRVGQAGIDVADLLQIEQGGGVVCVAEHIGGGLVNRGLACAGGRIGPGAGVDLQGVKAVRCGHDGCSL